MLKDSAIILNKKKSGRLYLNFFFKVNCGVGEPLIRTEMEAVERHWWIQPFHVELNPIKDNEVKIEPVDTIKCLLKIYFKQKANIVTLP